MSTSEQLSSLERATAQCLEFELLARNALFEHMRLSQDDLSPGPGREDLLAMVRKMRHAAEMLALLSSSLAYSERR